MNTLSPLEVIFFAALEKGVPEERAAYLDAACAGDADLRRRVEKMLAAQAQAGSFLEQPALAPGATVDSPLTERPGTVIGPYKLLQQIGEGGMGTVFMAEQTQPIQRKVAVKIIKPGMDSRLIIARFEAERQALALMDHVNIARVLDAGATESGRPYFVMELVHGIAITKYCDDNHLTPRERLELFVPVCQAIQHAHQKGIIHRDIKPSNVMITLYDGKPVPKVIDFGVAKATEQKLTERTLFTQYGTMVGTLEYMSPEQAEMSALGVDTRSDIYSLGVLLYELLTGSTPLTHQRFKDAAYGEILRIIKEEEPPKPSTRLSGSGEALVSISANRHTEPAKLTKLVRGELDWIVMKTLDKDRNRRYESASAFAADVQRYLADEPVQACPPSRRYRFRKFARRNKRALATLVTFALALVVVLGSLVISNSRISGEAREKTKALEAAKTSEQEAMENLKDALDAVDQMLTRVSEERLRDMPQMEPVRRELLQDALKFYQKFLDRRGDDPAIRRETALAYLRLASVHLVFGDYRKSEDAYRRAFAMFDLLAAESPLEPSIRSNLLPHYLEFSWALRNQGKNEEGEKALRRGVAVAEDLLKQFPQSSLYRDAVVTERNHLAGALVSPNLLEAGPPAKLEEAEHLLQRNLALTQETTSFGNRAQTYRNLGAVLDKQRRFSEAEDACRKGVLLFEKALAMSPSSRWMQIELAETLKQLAGVVANDGRLQEAEEICQRVIPAYDKFAADFPSGPHNRWGQAGVHYQHAWLLSKLERPTEAEQEYRRVVELSDKLAEDFPTLPGYLWTAVGYRRILAQFLAKTGQVQAAHQVYDGAAGMLEKLAAQDRPKALAARGHFHGALGEWDKAATDFTKAIELGSEDVLGAWYPLAVLHLQAKRTKEYRDLCEQLLKQLGQSEQHYVVITCKLAPDAVADLSGPVQIAERLLAREPQNAGYLGLLGAALYRKGDLEAATARLEAGIRLGPQELGVHWRKLVLAMAYHRLRRDAEAQQLFQEVTQWIEKNAQENPKGGAGLTPQLSWAHRLDLQLLHREAEVLLKQHPG
ncbi:MAG: protein kinase domain-containing protein [Gemmataceae bacterium]